MKTTSRTRAAALVVTALLAGAGASTVAPATAFQGGEDGAQHAATTNWKKIWRKKLVRYADRRYYTKAQTDAKFAGYAPPRPR